MEQTDPRSLRQKNFQKAVKTIGLSKVVEITGRQRSQVSDCAAGRRTIGEKLARKLESELGLEPGCLDLPDVGGSGIEVTTAGQHRVPLLPWEFVNNPNGANPLEILLTNMNLSPGSFAAKIIDQSMSPMFNVGDHIIVDPGIAPSPGDFVIASSPDGAVFRRYRLVSKDRFLLVPLNEDFPVLEGSDEVVIIGVMVEHRIYRQR